MRTWKERILFRAVPAAALVAVWLAGCDGDGQDACSRRTVQNDRYLVGAHYYLWYPDNFWHGYVRAALIPRQTPARGLYLSPDPETIRYHISLCSRYGVDFLSVDWWPAREVELRKRLAQVLAAPNIGDVKFCIFYEAMDLGYDGATGAINFTDAAVGRFIADMESFADDYFGHPSYLKVGGRPVVLVYLTRTFCGKFRDAMNGMRQSLAARGVDPFVIGDEVFWDGISEHDNPDGAPTTVIGPQKERIALLDAVFGYNMYESETVSHAGYGAASSFVADVERVFRQYVEAAGPDVAFVPDIIPGYNDRGVRPLADHYAIPRQWDAGMPVGSFFETSMDRLALPFTDPCLNMMLITSWNEWNEDTAIEPMAVSATTSRDNSGTGDYFTQGFEYEAHGTTYLEVLRDKVVAVSGRATASDGTPLAGATVCAWKHGRMVQSDAADSEGYYVLSRLNMPPGGYTVGLEDESAVRSVEVAAGVTTLDVNFSAP